MREDVSSRARRLVSSGRVTIRRVETDRVLAEVRGDSGIVRRVVFARGTGWGCSCPARSVCAHTRAVQLVVITDDEHEDPAIGAA